jgi:hypothetical protein
MVSDDKNNTIGHVVGFEIPRSGLTFLEQMQKLSLEPCKNLSKTPYLTGKNNEDKKAILLHSTCHLWSCETCALRNARVWIARIIEGCNRLDGDWHLLTLTAHRKARKNKSIENIRQGWKKLVNRISYEAGKDDIPLYYARVWEQHANGTFHCHVLINQNFGTRWLKDACAECGMGYQADWRKVDNAGQAAGYVAKYTLKNATISRGGIEWPKGLRRIETSRNWPKLDKYTSENDYMWMINSTREGQLKTAEYLDFEGYKIVDLVDQESIV